LADKGTLFLDEIGDMSTAVQAKLLRVLEESAFERVGGTKRIEVDIRLIAATNRDLGALIQKGEFRSDLYYRIAVMELPLPPLRERPGDIPLLVDHFISLYAQKYRKPVRGALAEVLDYWRRYDWPGNVRELQNAVNQAVLLCRGEWIDLDSLGIGPRVTQSPCADPFPLDQYQTLDDLRTAVITHYEGEKIKQALAHNDGNHSRTAKALGITRKTLAAKMRRYGL
jgi:transcriptional regulator with PAS, ATPase and Fis domain